MQAPWECIKHKWPYKAWNNENSVLDMPMKNVWGEQRGDRGPTHGLID